jgi:hypothetical protein
VVRKLLKVVVAFGTTIPNYYVIRKRPMFGFPDKGFYTVYRRNKFTGQTGVAAKMQICVCEVPGSNTGSVTGFLNFRQCLQANVARDTP